MSTEPYADVDYHDLQDDDDWDDDDLDLDATGLWDAGDQ